MGVLGNLDQYTKYQTAKAIPDAAKNPGGIAGAGMGLAAGVAIGGQMAGALGGAGAADRGAAAAAARRASSSASAASRPGRSTWPRWPPRCRDGSLTRDTLVWKQGMANWVAAETVPELQPLFAAVPPPLPN